MCCLAAVKRLGAVQAMKKLVQSLVVDRIAPMPGDFDCWAKHERPFPK